MPDRGVANADPCDPGLSNPIVCENSKPGNPSSEWDVVGAGDATIQGFATQISVNKGQTVSFKVKTDSPDYRIDIYRLGYYAGNGARKVATVQPSASLPQNQPACLLEPSTGLVDCGNWATSASWAVPSTATSGIYLGRLVREDAVPGASHIVFVVRDDSGHSDLLFQTSDTTWAAYNTYGGNSLYSGEPAGRAYKVSYNRPFTTRQSTCCEGSVESWLFNAEYPMVRWLERNGYDVSYSTGVDTDARGAELLEHEVFLSVGHDEYWSNTQRANVEAARNAGVHLAFFSGNEVFWKTRWEDSIDGTNTPRRTLVSYKETIAGAKIDPSPEWTGTWRDPRFSPPANGGRPENALTGTAFAVNAQRHDSILVPADDGKMRLWRNTTVATQNPGEVAALSDGTLGYEWDESPDNGARPPGLISLSKTTLAVSSHLQDYGSSYGQGIATHRLSLYRHTSGALVFGAGTVQWSWGLDETHDNGASIPDARMQQATVNLFADMGVQPGSLQSGLVGASASTDTGAPSAAITYPTNGTNIYGPTVITGTATDAAGAVGGVEITFDGGVTWHPADGHSTWTYSWSPVTFGSTNIRVRAVDDSGNIGQPSPQVTVNVAAGSVSFNDLISSVPLNAEYPAGQIDWGTGNKWWVSPPWGQFTTNSITFVQSVTSADFTFLAPRRLLGITAYNGGTESSLVTLSCNGNPPVTRNVGIGQLATIETGWGQACTTVTLSSSNGWDTNFDDFILDDAGIPPDTTPPVITNVQATTEGTRATITWSTNEPATSQVEYGTTTAYGSSNQVSGVRVTNHSVQLVGLTPDTQYHFRVKGRDFASNEAQSSPGTFTPTCPCTIFDQTIPSTEASTDSNPVELGMKFRSDVAGYVSAIRFYKGPGNTGQHTGSLWSATGELLATGVFENETGAGWQRLNFAAPVAISANTTYVASYYAPNGHYAVNGNYFNSPVISTPLRALDSTSSGGNGVYKYGPSGFPTNTYQAGNYWVDVVFAQTAIDLVPPKVLSQTPADAATGVSPTTPIRATFSEPINPATVNFSLKGPGGVTVPSTLTYNAATRTSTLQPDAVLGRQSTYTVNLSGAADMAGNVMAAKTWTFGTASSATSLWSGSTTPTLGSQSDPNPVELGLKFQTEMAGYISGIRFYKGAANTGTHVAHLWTSAGTLLASATFTGETASGWQQVNFASSVAVSPGTTYVASYHAPNGGYAVDYDYFALNERSSWPLKAPSGPDSNGNGVYGYGPSGTFPASTFSSSNYWVDVVFSEDDLDGPAISSRTPASSATDVSTTANVTATFSEPVTPSTISFVLRNASNVVVPSSVSYNAATRTATLDPTAALAASSSYSATVSGATDAVGNVMSPVNWTFSTAANCPCTMWPSSATPAVASNSDTNAVEVGVKFQSDTAGYITGLRFYKGPTNTGTHVAHLWTSGGTLLATATFTGETASGWQQVNFAAPVAVTANTTYVASYHAPSGGYSVTGGSFNDPHVRLPLSAPASATSGGNGLFGYGPSGTFPTNSFNASNYWVDVVFTEDPAPTLSSRTPAVDASDVNAQANLTATFSESVTQATISFVLRNAANAVVPSSVSYDSVTRTATLNPTATLTGGATYTATVSGATDSTGNVMSPATWSFSTAAGCPCTLWPASATPAVASNSDPNAIEVGVKFQSDTAGYITGVRFYKGPTNSGTHVAHLWTSGGNLLATATFTGETASGWQQANFATPVAVTANTTYVASYHAPSGGYSITSGFFNDAHVRSPLSAPASPASGGNGVYGYGPSGTFPASSANASNYWVDAVFTEDPAPTVSSKSPAAEATEVSTTANLTATFSESVNQPSISFVLRNAANAVVPSSVSYNAATRTATLDPTAALAGGATFTATVSGATDSTGNVMSPATWSFSTAADCPCTLWPSSATPAVASNSDPNAIEVGVKFQSDTAGYITGVRFYKGPTNSGTHVAHLWTSGGSLLATATFTGETASGWQQANFATPVAVTANTTYVASYHAPSGGYSLTSGFFANPHVRSPLSAPASATSGGNGVFGYGPSGTFPTSSSNAGNYWVDAVFTEDPAPTVSSKSPAADATDAGVQTNVTATFSESVNQSTISFVLRNASNAVVATNFSYNAATRTATLDPTASLTAGATYSVTVSGATDSTGNVMSPLTWSFSTADGCPCSFFVPADVPAVPTQADNGSVNLGLRFQSDVSGLITGLRFYKGATNTGMHTANLWSGTGTLLASATFTNETATGWQQVNFASPVAVTANTVYVASYHAPNGNYSVTGGAFANPLVKAPLRTASGANGVFGYGPAGTFPTNSFNSTNYWVDVIFTTP